MSLGRTMRQQRKDLGLTQDQVATKARISKPYLSNIETDKVKNPPTDDVLRRLERALGFHANELVRMAHLVVTPGDVREKYELLQAENQKLRSIVKRFLALGPRTPPGEIDLEALAEELEGAEDVRMLSAGSVVPVINRISAGYPEYFSDLDYPTSIAEEYIRCPDLHDPQAFAARVVGDSMEPLYREGDIVVFSPNRMTENGDDCFIRFGEDGGTTFKRFYQDEEATIRLQPLNSKYPAETHPTDVITGVWPAVYRIERLKPW